MWNTTYDQAAYDEEVRGIIRLVGEYAEKYQTEIPVVTAEESTAMRM